MNGTSQIFQIVADIKVEPSRKMSHKSSQNLS